MGQRESGKISRGTYRIQERSAGMSVDQQKPGKIRRGEYGQAGVRKDQQG
jgi:hypothetical protein